MRSASIQAVAIVVTDVHNSLSQGRGDDQGIYWSIKTPARGREVAVPAAGDEIHT